MELVSIPEAAKRLDVDRVTVWRWVQGKKLVPAFRVGNQAFFTEEYIENEARKLGRNSKESIR